MNNIYVSVLLVISLLLNSCGEEISKADEQDRLVEASMQSQFPGKIKRNGGKLTVRAASGEEHIFQDNRDENNGDNYVTHLASSRLPGLDWLIVSVGYYEGGGKNLISLNSGALFQFDGYPDPILSPDSQRVLIYSQDMEAGYSSNYIAIYKIDQNMMQLDVEFNGDGNEKDSWGPDNARWVDNETLAYDEVRYVADSKMQATHIKLKLIKGKWQKNIVGKSSILRNT
jgi:hypothetical protein